jgi:hypothetical protein
VNKQPRDPGPSSLTLFEWVFGFDYFIAYRHDSREGYARGLADRLGRREKPLRCFVAGGAEGLAGRLGEQLERAKRSSIALLVLCDVRTCESAWICSEISHFDENNRLVIPIDLDGSLARSLRDPTYVDRLELDAPGKVAWETLLRYTAVEEPDTCAVEPSDDVVTQVYFKYKAVRKYVLECRVQGAARPRAAGPLDRFASSCGRLSADL